MGYDLFQRTLAPEQCESTIFNANLSSTMLCGRTADHAGPHHNAAAGGWEWDDSGHLKGLNYRRNA